MGPGKLYVTILAPDVTDPELVLEEKRIYFKGVSRGILMKTDIKLLRGINVSESKHETLAWGLSLNLKKIKEEPCGNASRKVRSSLPGSRRIWTSGTPTTASN